METLANIALAASKLEAVERVPISKTSMGEDRLDTGKEESPGLQSRVVPPPPAKHPFSARRVVSIDSTSSFQLQPPSSVMSADDAVVEYEPQSELDPPPPSPSPTDIISYVLDDDVLCGRGGETNHHMGNIRYRSLVKQFQRGYLKAKRRDKPKIARMIVDTVRRRGGRFLKKDPSFSAAWKDVGNVKAREKTSQALREGAPELRNEETTSSEEDFYLSAINTTAPHVVELTPPTTIESKKRKFHAASNSLSLMEATMVSPTPSNTSLETTMGFVGATVSADDADDSAGENELKKSFRGPRLAILKKRLSMSG